MLKIVRQANELVEKEFHVTLALGELGFVEIDDSGGLVFEETGASNAACYGLAGNSIVNLCSLNIGALRY